MDIFEEIVRIRKAGETAALATIIRRIGSTPRKDNARMLIRPDGTSLGSVGGGCVEAEVWQKARQVIESGRSTVVTYEMKDEDVRNEGLVCGGSVEVFIEAIGPDPLVVIMGAGHLGRAIAQVAQPAGFRVAVLDDRESFANRERFPTAEQIIVSDFDKGLDQIPVNEKTYILVVTRGHSHDQVAADSALKTRARYVGLVGSRRKIQLILENILQDGLPVEELERFYAPIGLPIGSETPEEIAISVVAELIALRKGAHQRSEKQEFVKKITTRHLKTALAE